MAERLRAHLPLAAIFVVAGLAGTATLTYAAGRKLDTAHGTAVKVAPKPPLVVPDVEGQAFVFAKGALEDGGFAWKVTGTVRGYAANTVVSQWPAPGTRVIDTGTPPITLSLKRNVSYAQSGQAEDASPYPATALRQPNLASALGPAHPATTTAPAATTPAPTTTAPTTTTRTRGADTKATWPQNRPPAFTVPGGRKEPLDEMPLPTRALALQRWLEAHPQRTDANVTYWLYQNSWIVTGAKLGWWRGAEALTTLVAVDRRAQQLWGIGAKSANDAQAALAVLRSKSR
jgi:PASTA domain-containing protein